MKDKTLAKREAEVPTAILILDKHIAEFMEWYQMRKHVPVLKAVKTKYIPALKMFNLTFTL